MITLASCSIDGQTRLALVDGDQLALIPPDAGWGGPVDLIAAGEDQLEGAVAAARANGERVPLDSTELLAPVPRPGKFFAIGLNYADHIAESGIEAPSVPTVFAKFPTCVVGPGDAVERPAVSSAIDYEGELAFVIGRRCRHVRREDAADVIAGYTIVNDVSVRDWQLSSPQWSLAKSFDTHGPIGPWLTRGAELDPHDLRIETRVNGELRQSSSTSNLIFDCYDLVAHLSSACTLEPGDVIATGTPSGVGGAMDPPVYLEPGDEIEVEIEHLGRLVNSVVSEP